MALTCRASRECSEGIDSRGRVCLNGNVYPVSAMTLLARSGRRNDGSPKGGGGAKFELGLECNLRRRERKFRSRDGNVGLRGMNRRDRLDFEKPIGRRWPHLLPIDDGDWGEDADKEVLEVFEPEGPTSSSSVDWDFGFEPNPLAMVGLELSGEPQRLIRTCFEALPEDGEADARPCGDADVFAFVRANGSIMGELIAT